jgi:uncharacterized protein (DUF608 family)
MSTSNRVKTTDIYTIPGPEIRRRYGDNRMFVHFQGMSKTLQFPPTIALMGAPTCSIGISPEGLYNRLNDAGRLILLSHNGIQLGSAPFVRVADKTVMLTTREPWAVEGPDDPPALRNYYHPPVTEKQTSLSLATPLAELSYKLGKVNVVRRMISPLLSGTVQALMPISVEEFEVTNTSNEEQQVTLVIPRPSLVNLQEKELKPTDQDTVYACSTAVRGQVHHAFAASGMKGVVMASQECADRMVIAVPESEGASIDLHPAFCLNHLKQDLLLNGDGTFYEKRAIIPKQDYGAAISLTFTLKPKASRRLPVAVALDFPQQSYIDGTTFERKYVRNFKDKETRAVDLARIALDNHPAWVERTAAIQNKIFDHIRKSPSYKTDKAGALRLTRLILNEFSFPLSNACVWVEDDDGRDRARFLECFDYAYIDPSDVDWYSMVLLVLFPTVEQELCQRFIDSILAEDLRPRFYHLHGSFVEARKHFKEHPEEYDGRSLTQIWDASKIKGSVAHDVGALPKGHPLRNVSDYAWYNNNYWVDLFPKLTTRVLRNVKFLGDVAFLKRNWQTLKFGFDFLKTYDIDGDGIPEGNPHEVKNTFDNLTLFGVDAYDATTYMASCQAMKVMAEMMGDEPARKQYEAAFATAAAVFEKLWREKTNRKGTKLQYYVTCRDTRTGKMNTDVWTNQLDALWAMVAMGEEPFIPAGRVKQILRTIYKTNRTTMGWAMARTENAEAVESEQGQDVYTTSNYVFAQLLDYYGLAKESKEVYRAMDRVIFEHGNSLISPDNLRAELEQEAGETSKHPHYIVAAYPRPGAVLTHLVMQFVREQQERTGATKVDGRELGAFVASIFAPPQ